MAVEAETLAAGPPLCVDLDGTLILGDVLLESLLLLAKRNPLLLLLVPFWLIKGKAHMKAAIAARITLDPAALPYRRDLLEWLRSERSRGRALWLTTAADETLARRVAEHLGIFEGVLASDGSKNLAGSAKGIELTTRFGAGGFDYCGNERRDLAIWRHARGAILVGANRALEQQAARLKPVLRTFNSPPSKASTLVRALRPHQWAKNVLIFVPLLAAHRVGDAVSLRGALLAFFAFCLCASSVYIVNDLLDLEADRAHPRKSRRAFAAGDLSILTGLAFAPVLLGTAIAVGAALPIRFLEVFAAYYAVTLAYSFFLKKLVLVDVLALAGLYTLRVIAGASAIGQPLSFWLLVFSVFLFLSLAFVKRVAELQALHKVRSLRAAGRDYHVEDLPMLQSLGTAAGYISVLVLALYINSPEIGAQYSRPKVVWLLCVLMLYWISRMWMQAQRGAMHDDPVVFSLKDRMSLTIGAAAALTVLVAL